MQYSILGEMEMTTNGCSFDDSIGKATANMTFCCCWQMKSIDETKKKISSYRTGLVSVTMFIDLGRGIHRKDIIFF